MSTNPAGATVALTTLCAAICGMSLAWPAAAQPASSPASAVPTAPQADRETASQTINRLLTEDFDAQRRFDPLDASTRGDRRFDHLWPDVSPAGVLAQVHDARARLEALARIDTSSLDDNDRLSADLLKYELNLRIDWTRFKPWQLSVNQLGGPATELPQLPDRISFTELLHRENWVKRLETVDGYIDQIIANLRAGMNEGRVPPRVVMLSVPEQALAQAMPEFLDNPDLHPMFKPLRGAEPDLAERGRAAIRESVVPAFERLGVFLRDEYIPACRESIAAAEMPDGAAYYDFRLREMTNLELSAAQIHEIGLSEVARIRAEMFRVIARTDYPRRDELKGDELFAAFVEYLRTDPRFYFTDPDDLMNGYRALCKAIDAEMPALFGTMPRLPYGVREMPPFVAPSSPTAYYYRGSLENGVAGYFIVNTWRLDQRPRYEMPALALHEAVPGHHHQIALAQEIDGLHPWRTTLNYTAFVEGWGLYAESLGLEMAGGDGRTPADGGHGGLYADPYDDFGRLSYEMWRAMRLVVDTGMHALGWSREQAIDYMLANSALSRTNIEREVDRYIAWPGQAVAYKIGELKIKELRARAQTVMGDQFDIRAFHDVILVDGPIPLPVLEAKIERWIAATGGALRE